MSRKCCRAFTAECLACSENISIKEFCNRPENSDVVGCDHPGRVLEDSEPIIICGTKHSNITKSKKRIINRYY